MRTIASSRPRPERMWRTAGGGVVDAVEPGVLRQVAEPAAAVHDPGVRVGRAAEHLQQAGLAGAVAADQADLVAGAHREAGAFEDDVAAHLDRELPDLQHGRPCSQAAARPRRMDCATRAGVSPGPCPPLPRGSSSVRRWRHPFTRRGRAPTPRRIRPSPAAASGAVPLPVVGSAAGCGGLRDHVRQHRRSPAGPRGPRARRRRPRVPVRRPAPVVPAGHTNAVRAATHSPSSSMPSSLASTQAVSLPGSRAGSRTHPRR